MIIWSLILGVASYRIWRLIAEDSITEPLRARYLGGWLEQLVVCPWCLGSHIAFGVTWLTDATIGLQAPVLVALSAAVVVGLLGENA